MANHEDHETCIARGVRFSIGPAEVLNASFIAHVRSSPSLGKAAGSLARVTWPDGDKRLYAASVYEEDLRIEMLGRMHVDDETKEQTMAAEAIWANLPFIEAIETFLKRRLLSRKEFDRLADAHKSKAWTIAGEHTEYTREQTHASLTRAIEEGWSQQRWINEAQDQFDKMGVTGRGKYHLETVYETSVFSSYQHGRYQQQHSSVMLKMRPIWRYRTMGDRRVRESHMAMNGFTARHDNPIWDSWYPLNGFRCRCWVDALREGVKLDEQGRGVEPDEGFSASPAGWLK